MNRCDATALAAAVDPATPAEALAALSALEDPEVRAWVCGHHNASLAVLRRIAGERALLVHMAANPATPGYVLAQLDADDPLLAFWLVRHPNTPRDVLGRIAAADGDLSPLATLLLATS